MSSISTIIAIASVAIVVVLAIGLMGFIVSRLYHRTAQDEAFVRTGMGGAKVVSEGGAFVLPIVHQKLPVSLRTQKLVITRREKDALITKDSLRADVTVEFFVRVKKSEEAIKKAAQTLGMVVNDAAALKALVEGKFVDALRATAATMDLNDLHANRNGFIQQVQNMVAEALDRNGLELETASLVALDQTDKRFFNPENTFDAAGLTKICEITEARKKERFETEMNTSVAMAERERDARLRKLQVEAEMRNAETLQRQEIAEKEAESEALIAKHQAEARRKAQTAHIEADEAIRQREINRDLAVELANQEKEKKVADESKSKLAAEAAAAEERAKAIAAEERVKTAQAVEAAERQKQVELVEARKMAEKDAISVTVKATAARDSALIQAEATETAAKAEANAEKIRAEAKRMSYEVEAEGKERINQAENVISDRIIDMRVRIRAIEMLPQIIEQSVKPLEKIDSIRIVDVGGLNNSSGGEGAETSDGVSSFPDQVVSAALRHRVAAPLTDHVMNEVGLGSAGSIDGLMKAITAALRSPSDPEAGSRSLAVEIGGNPDVALNSDQTRAPQTDCPQPSGEVAA